MKRLIVLASAGILALTACSGSDGGEQPMEPMSTATVYVANQAGVPLEGIAVQVQQRISNTEMRQVGSEVTTDASGKATVSLPVNITAQIGLSDVPEVVTELPGVAWQNGFLVPQSDFVLIYQHPQPLDCDIVDPNQPSSCPEQPVPATDPTADPALSPTP